MPATYEPIASTTLGSNAATYTFSSIPATFTDLVVVAVARSSRTQDQFDAMTIRFNSDSANNYSNTSIAYGPTSFRNTGASSAAVGRLTPAFAGSTPHLLMAQIMSYANTSVYKTFLGTGASTAENFGTDRTVGLWRSTAAISSVTLIAVNASNFVAGSTFSLYGIKAA